MRATAATAALVLATVLATEGRAGEPPALWVVVNEANPVQTLSVDELRAIFTASLRFWAHGGPIAPFNAPAGTPNRVLFDEVVLRLGPREAGQFWVDQKVRGGPPPPRQVAAAMVLVAVVAKLEAAVGYVPAGTCLSGVKVVAVVEEGRVRPPGAGEAGGEQCSRTR